jgi:predicted RNA-binding protein
MEGRGQFAGGQMVRGTVTAVTTDKLTIKTEAGEVYQIAVSPNTRMMKARQPVKVTDIKVGDSVGAGGELDAPNKTVHALFVMVVDAEQVKQMRENLGKTYIMGKVTAIDMDELKLTIERPDKVSQVIAVDEGTSFRRGGRMMMSMINSSGPVTTGPGQGGGQGPGGGPGPNAGGESITLADIKVGDMVGGQGSLKNGIFVPTQLGVADPSQQRRRRAEDGAQNGVTAPKIDAAPSNAPH